MADRNINASRKRILWCWRRYPVSRPEVAATPSITLIREFDVYLTKIDGSQHHGPINLSAADTLRQLSEAGRGAAIGKALSLPSAERRERHDALFRVL